MPPKAPLDLKGRKEKEKKGKGKPKSRKRHKLNLKGWLKTPADWARFNAWAKINAQPRKYPEPEPIIRPAKPLAQMKKRILILSLPHRIQLDPTSICRTDLSVSKAALKAKASKRTKELSRAILRKEESCREFPLIISRAALRYKPSQRIIMISQPRVFEPEECKSLEISANALKHKTSQREEMMSLAKKMIEHSDLMVSAGVRRSASTYELTAWMAVLSLPSYRFLKDRQDETAKAWKKQLLEEGEERGKRALEEKRKKEGRKKKGKKTEKVQDVGDKKEERAEEAQEEEDGKEGGDVKDEKEKKNEKGKEDRDVKDEKEKKKEEEKRKRKEERNAWRYEPSPCKEDIFSVKKSAKKVSPRVEELAKPHVHENKSCRVAPFSVRKGALQAQASPRIVEMAKPSRSLDPVEREPQREKDKYGRPIFPKPKFGKVMPKVKPYKMGECKDKEEEEKKKKPKSKTEKIDPIAFEPSIDPCFDFEGAKRQNKAREAVKNAKNNKDAKIKEQEQNA